jgi:hypothetical protein
MKTLPKPYPPGPLGENPANNTAKPAGEPPDTGAPHHEALRAVTRRARLDGLRHAAHVARSQGDHTRAGELAAEIAAELQS